MFCPKCATQNQDQTNFCRNCGTDLKAVALLLGGQAMLPGIGDTLEKKAEMTQSLQNIERHGLPRLVQGSILFLMGLLLAIPLNLFSTNADWHANWIIVWLLFCGWLPVMGAMAMGTGLSNLIQARLLQRR